VLKYGIVRNGQNYQIFSQALFRYLHDWAREFLWSRAETIFSGSSEVQKNILAKRALGLPDASK